jgi:hypothetical protein
MNHLATRLKKLEAAASHGRLAPPDVLTLPDDQILAFLRETHPDLPDNPTDAQLQAIVDAGQAR